LIAVVVIGSLRTASPASTVTTSTLLTLPPTTQPITTVPQPTLPPYTTVLPAAGSHAGAIVRLKIGRTIRLPPGRNGGIASITVVTFKAPYTPSTANPYVDSPPPPGYEDAVAGVRECTGSAALPAGPSDDLWALVVPAGEIAPYGPDAERPGLQQILYVAPHHCVFGYITFAIAPRSRSLALVYAGSSTAVWLLPQRSNARSIA
jgi:hypothetical protein